MRDTSIITLKKEAVKNNIHFLKKKIGAKTKISSVVKANAYGHGIEQISPLFENEGITHFSVFDFPEAVRVNKCTSDNVDIMIMGWISSEDIVNAIKQGFEFYIFNLDRLNKALKYAKETGIKAKIHIEAETGMNRSGLNINNFKKAVSIISANSEHFIVKGFCTHLAGAESISNYVRIQKQLKKYYSMLSFLEKNNIIPEYRHVANSAAAFVYPKARMDLVRIGIMLYGFWSSAETFIHFIKNKKNHINPLKRILGWESKIMAIKEVKTGEFIGYGTSFLAQSDIKTALVPIGYSDSYNRSFSNKGRVLINGQRCGVIGVVNMNMIIVDITGIYNAKVEDEVVIIGKQNDLEIKVSAFSDIGSQLNYETLANLPINIKRKII